MGTMTSMISYPEPVIREKGGLVTIDIPTSLAVIRAMAKYKCEAIFDSQSERIAHFVKRIHSRNLTAEDVVIVLLQVGDSNGFMITDILMPGHDWQSCRDRGEIPFARGIAGREGIQKAIDSFDIEAGNKLRQMDGIAVVVVDHGVAEVFQAD